jgi:hypothetical protein
MSTNVVPKTHPGLTGPFITALRTTLSSRPNFHTVEKDGSGVRITQSYTGQNTQLKILCFPLGCEPRNPIRDYFRDYFEIRIYINDSNETVYKFNGRLEELGETTDLFLKYVTQFVTIDKLVLVSARSTAITAVKLILDTFPESNIKKVLEASGFHVTYDIGKLHLKSKGIFDGPAFDYTFEVGVDWDETFGRLISILYPAM